MFYKFEINDEQDINKIVVSPHAIISVKCIEHLVPKVREILDNNTNVEEYRIITVVENKEVPEEEVNQLASKDHLQQFKDYIIEKLGTGENIIKELQEVINVN